VAPDDLLLEQESGRSAARPQWQRLLELIRAGEVSTVWADRSDRLARDLFETRAFFALCARTGTGWKFWSEPWLDSDAPEAEELRQRAAFDGEMESRKIGSRLRRHYQHAAQQGLPRARRSPFGLRLEGSGEARRYVLDDRALVGELTVAEAAQQLVALYLRTGAVWSAVAGWKDDLRELAGRESGEPGAMLARALAWNHESVRGWLELAAAELQGHTTANRYERVEPEDGSGKPTYRRLPWESWRLTRNTHPALVDAATARRVLALLAENGDKGRAIARRRSSDAERMPSFTPVAFCTCGRRLRQQSTRAGRREGEPAYRTLRCSGARRAVGLCDQPGISERKLCYELLPLLVAEAERVAGLMVGGSRNQRGPAAVAPELQTQLEQARALLAGTGLPEARAMVLALETRLAAAEAEATADHAEAEGRAAAAAQLAAILPSIGPDLFTVPGVRRQVLQAVERIEVSGGHVVGVRLAG
jgi:DNA invertase Pin-like site-specific DNA recombinase